MLYVIVGLRLFIACLNWNLIYIWVASTMRLCHGICFIGNIASVQFHEGEVRVYLTSTLIIFRQWQGTCKLIDHHCSAGKATILLTVRQRTNSAIFRSNGAELRACHVVTARLNSPEPTNRIWLTPLQLLSSVVSILLCNFKTNWSLSVFNTRMSGGITSRVLRSRLRRSRH
ncbi:hypothetical protein BT93_F0024 [Corymbia citriodora subsp. variegata]|nr:hypothetical protein BT93_F0024 [Corymbia citriodora subsp. variegata]